MAQPQAQAPLGISSEDLKVIELVHTRLRQLQTSVEAQGRAAAAAETLPDHQTMANLAVLTEKAASSVVKVLNENEDLLRSIAIHPAANFDSRNEVALLNLLRKKPDPILSRTADECRVAAVQATAAQPSPQPAATHEEFAAAVSKAATYTCSPAASLWTLPPNHLTEQERANLSRLTGEALTNERKRLAQLNREREQAAVQQKQRAEWERQARRDRVTLEMVNKQFEHYDQVLVKSPFTSEERAQQEQGVDIKLPSMLDQAEIGKVRAKRKARRQKQLQVEELKAKYPAEMLIRFMQTGAWDLPPNIKIVAQKEVLSSKLSKDHVGPSGR